MPNPYQSAQNRERILTEAENEVRKRVAAGEIRGALPGTTDNESLIRTFESICEEARSFATRDLIVNDRGDIVHRVTGMGFKGWFDQIVSARPFWTPLSVTDTAYSAFILCNKTSLGALARELGSAEALAEEAARWKFDLNHMDKPGVVPPLGGNDKRSKGVSTRLQENPWTWASDTEQKVKERLDAIGEVIRTRGTAHARKLAAEASCQISGAPIRLAG